MASEQFEAAYEAAMEKLSLKDQDMLAKDILERIEEMEWDEKWEELLASPESVADTEKMKAKIKASREAETSVRYIPGKSLGELFSPRV